MTRSIQPAPDRFARRAFAAAAAWSVVLLAPAAAGAQRVGYPPEASPYRDVPYRQELTVFGGWFAAQADPAGVAPRSGPLTGLRYEIRVGGPANFYARLAGAFSERTVVDPAQPEATRRTDESTTLYLADLGIALNLTGQKSWHNLVPVVSGGVGLASDFQSRDVGGYRFGTPFAIALGGGIRYVPGGNFQLRVDVTDHLYQIRYPNSYFTPQAAGLTPVLPATQSQNMWRHNAALTIGASWLFAR